MVHYCFILFLVLNDGKGNTLCGCYVYSSPSPAENAPADPTENAPGAPSAPRVALHSDSIILVDGTEVRPIGLNSGFHFPNGKC